MSSEYRLLSYRGKGDSVQAGMLVQNLLYPVAPLLDGIPEASSVIGLLKSWDKVHSRLHAAAGNASGGQPLSEVVVLAPILYPGALFCAVANYWDHHEEMAEIAKRTTGKALSMTKGAEPWFFLKTTAGSIVGPNSPVRLPCYGGSRVMSAGTAQALLIRMLAKTQNRRVRSVRDGRIAELRIARMDIDGRLDRFEAQLLRSFHRIELGGA